MDSSHICGGSDKFQSIESGWTMYIASSKNYNHNEDEQESDDSLASDASSGPSYQGKSRALEDDQKEQNNGLRKKNIKLSSKKQILEEEEEEKKKYEQDVGFVYSTRADPTTTTSTSSQTGSKVGNKFWKGRTK